MSQRRKHVTQAILNQDVQPPGEGQRIVRALGSRGSNIVEVELPCGQQTLCMMPAKFNKKLWVKRGGYLIINESQEAQQDSNTSITGTIAAVLYDDHIKALKRMPGVWPLEFQDTQSESMSAAADDEGPSPSGRDGGESNHDDSSSDDGLPPLEANQNRRVIYHEVSESDEDSEGEEMEQQQQQQPTAQKRPQHLAGAAGS